jgi:Protein of unknown function (DUF2817)
MNDIAAGLRRARFPESHAEGRRWFAEAVQFAGGELEVAEHPTARGPAGEPLGNECAWIGPLDASRVLLSISGTHGQEYFAGAALQMRWLVDAGRAALPPDVAVCLLHSHNPFGAAHGSRANENFVDLNRNYFEGSVERPNPLYPELFEQLFTRELDEHRLDDAMDAWEAFLARHDAQAALDAMGAGQVTHPSGNLYCGAGPEWSTQRLRSVVRQRLGGAAFVAVIDWHTGLGDFGVITLLPEAAGDARTDAWVRQCWGSGAAADALHGPTRPRFVGCVAPGVAAELRARGAHAASAVAEIGTVDNRSVLAALLIDRWLRFECSDRSSPHAVRMHTMMMERLNPTLSSWRESVIEHGLPIYRQTIEGLAAWR